MDWCEFLNPLIAVNCCYQQFASILLLHLLYTDAKTSILKTSIWELTFKLLDSAVTFFFKIWEWSERKPGAVVECKSNFFSLGIFENAYDLEFSSWAYSTLNALIFSASFLLFQVVFPFTLLQAIKFLYLHFYRK